MPKTLAGWKKGAFMRSSVTTTLFLAAVIGTPVVMADPIDLTTYAINFNGSPTAGTFTYDPDLKTFSSFSVVWFGDLYNLTSSANNPLLTSAPPCIGPLTGGAATFALLSGACTPQPTGFFTYWQGEIFRGLGETVGVFRFTVIDELFDNSQRLEISGVVHRGPPDFIIGPDGEAGSWSIVATGAPAAPVPEPFTLIPMALIGAFLGRKRIAQGLRQVARRTR
jgi:hypothetical protein